MPFIQVRIHKSDEPEKYISGINKTLDILGRTNAAISRSILNPKIFIAFTRYESFEEQQKQYNENIKTDMSVIGSFQQIRTGFFVRENTNDKDGKILKNSNYAVINSMTVKMGHIDKIRALGSLHFEKYGKDNASKGIGMWQHRQIIGEPMNRLIYVTSYPDLKSAEDFLTQDFSKRDQQIANELSIFSDNIDSFNARGLFEIIRHQS